MLSTAETDDLFARTASVSRSSLPHPGGAGACGISFYFRACAGCAPVTLKYVVATQVAPEMDTVWWWFDQLLGAIASTNPRNDCSF